MQDAGALSPVRGHESGAPPPPAPPPPPAEFDPSIEQAPLPPPTPDAEEGEDDGGLGAPVFTLADDEPPSPGAAASVQQPLPGAVETEDESEAHLAAPEASPSDLGASPGGGGLASVLEAVAEAQAATGSAEVLGLDAPPPTPFLPKYRSPQEAYEAEEQRLSTAFQREAFKQLKEWDEEAEGRFDARQAVNLVRRLASTKAKQESRSWLDILSCSGFMLTWIVLVSLILLVPMTLAGALSREFRVQETGAVVMMSDSSPAAAAAVVTRRKLGELRQMPEAELRQIRDCTFVHRGAFHRLSVASLVRSPAGGVQLASPDRSILKIDGVGSDSLAVAFSRPFVGEQKVDLQDPSNSGLLAGCSFHAMTDAQSRSTPSL